MRIGPEFRAAISACLILLLCSSPVAGVTHTSDGQVAEAEAVAIADLWYAMELNSKHSGLDEQARTERLEQLPRRKISYFALPGILQEIPPVEGPALAYVAEYEPCGYVVVAGTDRLQAILAHSIEASYWWDEPGLDLVRNDFSRGLSTMWQDLPAEPHSSWTQLRAKLAGIESLREASFPEVDSYVLWESASWAQGWPYNEVVAAQNGSNPNVPTGCVATAMGIKFRFHQWPIVGNGIVQYDDTWGSVQFSHSVNYGDHTYIWANMPLSNLAASNLDVANLMYHCGVAIHINYEEGSSGGSPEKTLLEPPFRYKATEYIFSEDYGGSEHVGPLTRSLFGGLIILVASDSHAMVVTGYRNQFGVEEFWINHGHGGPSNGWQTLASADIRNSWPYSAPTNYIYVDAGWSGDELGWIQKPYNTFQEGLSAIPDGGQMWLRAGTYTGVPPTLSQPMVIKSHEGPATLGP
jgi:hypothetical protein